MVVADSFAKSVQEYLKKTSSSYDDDAVDRLNYVYTINLLALFAITIFTGSYVGEPLQCWVPNQWKDHWETYAESYCFVENTYFVHMNKTNLPAQNTREQQEMIYYQWVPFIFVIMSMLFYIPRLAWKLASSRSNLVLTDLMEAARKTAKEIKEVDDKQMNTFVHRITRRQHGFVQHQNALYNSYVLMKILLIVNLFVQFLLLNAFFGASYVLWGGDILWNMLHGRHWQDSGHFPRVAFCDLTVREMGNVNNWTVQCVLQVNMFNEKIFLFLWFWLVLLLIITVFNAVLWIHRRISAQWRKNFLRGLFDFAHIHASESVQDNFYHNVLRDDGVLVLKLLDSNAGMVVSSELLKKLYAINQNQLTPQTSTDERPTALYGKA